MDWGGEPHPVAGLAEALAAAPLASRLEGLDLQGQCPGVAAVRVLAGAPLHRLRRLDLSGNNLADEGLQVLLAAPWAAGLRERTRRRC